MQFLNYESSTCTLTYFYPDFQRPIEIKRPNSVGFCVVRKSENVLTVGWRFDFQDGKRGVEDFARRKNPGVQTLM